MVFHAGQIRFRGRSLKMFHVIVEELGKDYRIYARPVDRLLEAIFQKQRHRALRAVQGVSFNLLRGQSLGIIGDNGAGKSTLLKLLVGTVSPTVGKMVMSGRVTALLELGAGFHPEFSGRQNIFMNASLFGLSPEEIGDKEEAIIDFSGLSEFIDRPVKTYSSGMYVRLGFAIATSVDPDILIIDEALAVGDMAFQRKCIDRMNLFRDQGKTMIFCSHSMYHVKELCDKTLWLDRGRMKWMGPTMEVVAQYEDFCRGKEVKTTASTPKHEQLTGSGECRIRTISIESAEGKALRSIQPLTEVVMKMEVEIFKDALCPQFGFALMMSDETVCFCAMTHHDHVACGPYRAGEIVHVRVVVQEFPVREGNYRLLGAVSENSGLLWYDYKEIGPLTVAPQQGLGLVAFRRKWEIR